MSRWMVRAVTSICRASSRVGPLPPAHRRIYRLYANKKWSGRYPHRRTFPTPRELCLAALSRATTHPFGQSCFNDNRGGRHLSSCPPEFSCDYCVQRLGIGLSIATIPESMIASGISGQMSWPIAWSLARSQLRGPKSRPCSASLFVHRAPSGPAWRVRHRQGRDAQSHRPPPSRPRGQERPPSAPT